MKLKPIKPLRIFVALGAIVLLGHSLLAPEAVAGRYVLNQTPATIEKSFGRYWTKLTQKNDNGTVFVTYWYSPAKVRRLFPDRPATTLSMTYVDNRVQSIDIIPYKTKQDVADQSTPMNSRYLEDLKMQERYFEAVFGYRPPTYRALYLNYGSFYSYRNCLGNGVMSAYTFHFDERLVQGISFSYNAACEPPYDQIRFTEEKGPSGG